MWSANASQTTTLSGTVPATGLNGLYSNPISSNHPANGFAGDGGGLNNVNAVQLGGRTAAQFWQTGGNAGADPARGAFLGTSDNLRLGLNWSPAQYENHCVNTPTGTNNPTTTPATLSAWFYRLFEP